MRAKVTICFIDPNKEFLSIKDFNAVPAIPRIGEYVTVNNKKHQRKVENVVYFFEDNQPNYQMISVHVSD